ncbi:MAG TPA: bifunctional NADH-specific enoyl-ACP reductase/trans-2-enoyl-CoA reductase [Opitutae bacterium]|nr:bifunctional NADH-specific enoyl-ACP reductase/trans-2-enoyl-CoA reductase [Opitutae bacterium]|tara:strand:+ start:2341 stop:3531 length:1191 start_codon:yes stop_codon:yes gene_type:complete
MIIKPRIKGFVCITAHPSGCLANLRDQVEVASSNKVEGEGKPKRVLVVGASTGYGLASRVSAAFSAGADTMGVYFERPPKGEKTASAGFYNSAAFCKLATEAGLSAVDVNGDAFSNECKEEVVKRAKETGGPFDLVVYSLASPRRTDPADGNTYRACLKPIGAVYKNKTLDTDRKEVKEVTIDPASEQEVADTRKVMGGEDWEAWTDLLLAEGLLAPGCLNLAYSYIGPEVTWPIYRNGTIGKAKEHLEDSASAISEKMKAAGCGGAYVSVNKAVVTQASSAIPVVPLYVSMLFKIMGELRTHEGCIEQTSRLFSDRLYGPKEGIELDDKGRIRLDDWEMEPEVQSRIVELWPQVCTENLRELTSFDKYQKDFLSLFGFGHPSVDYEAEVDPENPY